MDAATAAVYADVLRDPARAEASSLLYRALPAARPAGAGRGPLARRRGRPAGQAAVRPRGDGAQAVSQLGGLERARPAADVEVVDGGHFLVDEQPGAGRRPRPRVVRLITWNVARRVEALAAQAAALGEREPDVVALQEVTARTLPLWEAACATLGLPHVRARWATPTRRACRPARGAPACCSPRASRSSRCRRAAGAVAGDRAGGARRGDRGATSCTCPTRPTGRSSRRRWRRCARPRRARRAAWSLCGDLNTPRREQPDGTVWSFARDGRGRLREERAGFWDEAELGVVPGLRELGFTDAFRALHGYGVARAELDVRRIAGHGGGWRLDHVFCSAELAPRRCAYHHDWRDGGPERPLGARGGPAAALVEAGETSGVEAAVAAAAVERQVGRERERDDRGGQRERRPSGLSSGISPVTITSATSRRPRRTRYSRRVAGSKLSSSSSAGSESDVATGPASSRAWVACTPCSRSATWARATACRTTRRCWSPRRAPSCAAGSPPRGCPASRRRASCTRGSCPRWRAPRRCSRSSTGGGRTMFSALVLNPKGLDRAIGAGAREAHSPTR